MRFEKQFDKKRGALSLEYVSDTHAVVIESHFKQYEGTSIHTKVASLEECRIYFNQRWQELSPPRPRKDNNTRI